MPKIKILVVEDEEIYAQQIEILIEELNYQCIGIVDNSKDAIEMSFATKPDIILMDINLNESRDGIQIAEKINERQLIPTIFITSLNDEETFNRAKSTRPVAYITKPFSSKKLQRTIELVVSRLDHLSATETNIPWSKDLIVKDSFFIKVKNTLEKIIVSEILWIEVMNRDCTIVTKEKELSLRMPLKELIAKLPAQNFVRTHRSFIANIHHIQSIDLTSNKILIDGKKILLSKTHKDNLIHRLELL